MIPIRRPTPQVPGSRFSLMASALIVCALALLPQVGHSTTAKIPTGSAYSDLGAPVAQIISLRAPQWIAQPARYQPLPIREERLNVLLSNAVDVLTRGEAVESRARLMGLQASLHHTLQQLQAARQQLATAPAQPCDGAEGLALISCRFEQTRAEQTDQINSLRSTIRQRQEQIVAERVRFAGDLQKIGINIKPEQASGLLQMATARDIISLHAVYANLKEINSQLQQAAKAEGSTPASIRRYYGLYTVLLEVAMHMHEDLYFKLRNNYLPRLDALAGDTADTYRQARRIAASSTRADLKAQLHGNMNALTATLKAALLYREALEAQAAAVNASWKSIHEQHQVAVNSFRTASLSADLLEQMKSSGQQIANLRNLDIPAIDSIGNAALQREFERLTLEIQLPNT